MSCLYRGLVFGAAVSEKEEAPINRALRLIVRGL